MEPKIKKSLDKLNKKESITFEVMVNKILSTKKNKSIDILSNLRNSKGTETNLFNFDFLERKNIYHENAIKKLCIDYKLRFLPTFYFKSEYPISTIKKIKDLEDLHQIEISNFKIIAPEKSFKLNNYDDPMLFAELGNGFYYYIDSWGKDFHWLRKIICLPTKKISNRLLFSFFISFIVASLISFFSKNGFTNLEFILVKLFCWKCLIAIDFYWMFKSGKYTSEFNWNSPYFNN